MFLRESILKNSFVVFILLMTNSIIFAQQQQIDRLELIVSELGGCPEPSAFMLTGVTSDSSSFIWGKPAGDIEGYAINLYEPGADPNVDPPLFIEGLFMNNTGVVTGLEPETSYDAFVQTVCFPTGTVSEFVGPVSFTTTSLGVNDTEELVVKIYPNPTVTSLNFQSVTPIDIIKVLDISGKELFQCSPNALNYSLDTSTWASGTYFVCIEGDNQTSVQKINRR